MLRYSPPRGARGPIPIYIKLLVVFLPEQGPRVKDFKNFNIYSGELSKC